MLAIIDSGSTKADWIFSDSLKNIHLSTSGMNPFFNDVHSLVKIIEEGVTGKIAVEMVDKIYFFGAGCSDDLQKKKIADSFKSVFKNSEIVVDHDIMGAVLSTCGNEKGISCIIGTGSNSVYFDGERIHPNNYGLGYILADEGAGTYLGKKLITAFLYGLLPGHLSTEFKKEYNLSREEVINNVYNKPLANAWLAGFAKFFILHKNEEWVRSTIKKGFEKFVELYVLNYPNYLGTPVHFVGSIAFHYSALLEEVAREKKFTLGKVIQKPIEELADYFIRNISGENLFHQKHHKRNT
jgi:N-acetylglucosamine kinase-like BadF-type ATPase